MCGPSATTLAGPWAAAGPFTRSAGFSLEDAVTLEEVAARETPQDLLRPVDAYFAGEPILLLTDPAAEKLVRNGGVLSMPGEDGRYRVYSREKEFLALSRLEQGRLTTIKSFFEV